MADMAPKRSQWRTWIYSLCSAYINVLLSSRPIHPPFSNQLAILSLNQWVLSEATIIAMLCGEFTDVMVDDDDDDHDYIRTNVL